MPPGSQSVLKRRMAVEMRTLREHAGVSRDEAAGVIHSSVQTIGHIETGRSLPSGLQIEKLLAHYGAADRIEAYLELRVLAKASSDWWTAITATMPAHRALLLGAEATAVRIEAWDPFRVPELAQTADYARALADAVAPDRSPGEVDTWVELLVGRQHAVFDRRDTPEVVLLVGESALRDLGDPVMVDQVEYLLELAERPTVRLRVVPLSAGAPAGPFTVLTFAGPGDAPGAAYAETLAEGYYYDSPAHLARYRSAVAGLDEAAVDFADAPAFALSDPR